MATTGQAKFKKSRDLINVLVLIRRIFTPESYILIGNLPHRKIVKDRKYRDGNFNHHTLPTQRYLIVL